jgi:hypothetical protein
MTVDMAGRRSSSGERVADEPSPRTIGWTEAAVSPSKMVALSRRRFGHPERSDVILIPELERGDLNAAMTSAARNALETAVYSGTGFILMDSVAHSRGPNLLNNVFGGYSVSGHISAPLTTVLTSAAVGTPFQGGPVSLPWNDRTESIFTSTLPSGALNLYAGGNRTTVFAHDYGAGRVGWLGWDWYDAQPIGPFDGGWVTVLDRMVSHVNTQSAIPEPTSLAIWSAIALGGLGLAYRRRKRAAHDEKV